ncbi:MAG: tetratricopeptide repeat protein [Deltaproteobacteria bacterium]|nr:tetratricopeptide repeat protein [Deltaproteobacteria bacterium]
MPSLEQLLSLAAKTKKPLPWYGVAMEYRALGRLDEALVTFQQVHELDAGYVPAYFMCAQILAERGEVARARAELAEGMARARAAGDDHAEAEMRDLLETLS